MKQFYVCQLISLFLFINLNKTIESKRNISIIKWLTPRLLWLISVRKQTNSMGFIDLMLLKRKCSMSWKLTIPGFIARLFAKSWVKYGQSNLKKKKRQVLCDNILTSKKRIVLYSCLTCLFVIAMQMIVSLI